MAIQRLTAAYRSRSRPSSTLGAKASTMCPYYLDGDLGKSLTAPPGDTRYIGYCAVFKVREEAERDTRRHGTLILTPPASRRSLKTQQHAKPPHLDAEVQSCGLPDPVDMSSGRLRSGERRGARELRATIRRQSVPSG
jgi:hypothetical protein